MPHPGLAIGLVTPYSWSRPGGVNRHVGILADRLTQRGHRVTIIAPSADRTAVRRTRQAVREVLMEDRAAVFDPDQAYPRLFVAGGTYSVRLNRTTKLIAASADLLANVDVLLSSEDLDVLHIHEPLVPGLGWTSLRHAGRPLVATFHVDSEQFRTYWLARRARLQRYVEAFDHVLAVSRAVRDSLWRAFEGDVEVLPDCVDTALFAAARAAHDAGDGRAPAAAGGSTPPAGRRIGIVYSGAAAPRTGLRHLLRALRRSHGGPPAVRLDVVGDGLTAERYGHLVPEGLPVRFHGALSDADVAPLMAGADILCAPAPEAEESDIGVVQGMAAGLAVVVSDVAGHRELIDDGVDGLLVTPRQPRTLAHVLRDLAEDPARRRALGEAAAAAAARYDVDVVADRLEEVYAAAAGRRRERPQSAAARRVSAGPAGLSPPAGPSPADRQPQAPGHHVEPPADELFADFHMHSEHSKDCVVPVRDLLARAVVCGLDVIAITDHDTADGGLEGRELAAEYGLHVIVGEEVKTTEGEVVGLFLERTIPAGMSFADTIAAIKEQDGIVYLPHPFDRLHTVPSYSLLKQHVDAIDVVEVFNSRLAFPAFNERAELFAQRYRIAAAAGSDAHVLASLGTAMTAMGRFEGRHDFLDALVDSRIIRRPKSYLYLTGLKFLQTNFEGAPRRADPAPLTSSAGGGRRRGLRERPAPGGRQGVPPDDAN